MSNEDRSFPYAVDFAAAERRAAEKRVVEADNGMQETNAILAILNAAIDGVRSLHVENGYAPKIRAIFRS